MDIRTRRVKRQGKLSSQKLKEIVHCFAMGRTVSAASRETSISRKTIGPLFRDLRRRIVEDPYISGGAWSTTSIPPRDSDHWKTLFKCIYDCPNRIEKESELVETIGPRLAPNRGGRRKRIRLTLDKHVPCENCAWKLTEKNFNSVGNPP